MLVTSKVPPKILFSTVVPMTIDMPKNEAFRNGYKHGYEGVVTPDICILYHGSEERKEWMRGYHEGSVDGGHDDQYTQ